MIEDLTGVIEITQRIEASPETVFAYLTDSQRFVRWMGVGAELDARPGGRYRIDVDGVHIARGAYEIIDPPRRLVMTRGGRAIRPFPLGRRRSRSRSRQIGVRPSLGFATSDCPATPNAGRTPRGGCSI
jgi:hypothetical protein